MKLHGKISCLIKPARPRALLCLP